MIRAVLAIGALFSVIGCFARDVPSAAQSEIAEQVVFQATATIPPDSPMCSSFATPLPTPTPGAPLLAPAASLDNPPFPGQTGRSELLVDRFHSDSVDMELPLMVYLPPGYFDSSRRYPVLYMLSGFAGDYREWVDYGLCDDIEWLTRGGHIQPMIVVMPDGNRSWWFNHAPVPGSDGKPWGDYIWKDLVNYVDANYRTLRQPSSRAVGGLSAGGQGALMFGLMHPEVFRVIGAHSPSLRRADGSLPFFGDQDYFDQYDPLWLLDNVTTWQDLVIWIDVGSDDTQWGQSIHELHDLMTKLSIPHEFHDTWAGIHDGYYWGAHIVDYLIWYSSHLVGQ